MIASAASPIVVGRYAMFDRVAAGGMATVHVGRLVGQGGFARTVAIKRLHPQFALDPEFAAMFLDEARLAARIHHPNVVSTLDVVTADGELFLVMEYVDGESLATLLRTTRERGEPVPFDVAAGIMVQALHGLHAAHDARNDHGEPLDIVHRDVSPQNVLVGAHGTVRVLDFGVAKALGKLHTTREGQLKGKLGYLAPEQVLGLPVTRRSDVFAAAVVLWEVVAGRRLFEGQSEGEVLRRIMEGAVNRPSVHRPDVPSALEGVVMRALSREPIDRFDTALAMAEALDTAGPVATSRAIGEWMRTLVNDRLAARAQLLGAIESQSALAGPVGERSATGAPSSATAEAPAGSSEAPTAVATFDSRSGLSSRRRRKRSSAFPRPLALAVGLVACVASGSVVVARTIVTRAAPVDEHRGLVHAAGPSAEPGATRVTSAEPTGEAPPAHAAPMEPKGEAPSVGGAAPSPALTGGSGSERDVATHRAPDAAPNARSNAAATPRRPRPLPPGRDVGIYTRE